MNKRSPVGLVSMTIISLALMGCVAGSSVAAVGPAAVPMQAGTARVWFLQLFTPAETLATPIISANGTPIAQSQLGGAFFHDFPPGTYTFTVPSYGVDTGQAQTVQLVAGTQTYLEVQSLRSWADSGDNTQRDTLYVRAISPVWAEKYFAMLTYFGPR
jgi:hypothetical protein